MAITMMLTGVLLPFIQSDKVIQTAETTEMRDWIEINRSIDKNTSTCSVPILIKMST